ncbi:MAG: ABC transporter permease subunit [Candidatus Nanopelagicales bacterium]|jgi:NitT/TauT family transport system permease protein|nr:ABC transporter permease subunit [Candidatus Nanopelagicales bacterium]
MNTKLGYVWPPILVAAIFLGGWQLLVVVQDLKPFLLPAPSLIASEFSSGATLMWGAAYYTATTAFLGLIFGTVLGLITALLAQRFITVGKLAAPLAAGLATVPIIALTPILNNMFNITSRTPRVLVTAIIVLFPIFVNVTRGLIQVNATQLELMRSLNATPRTTLRVLRVPNAIPFFFTGLKIAAPLAVIAALVAEYFGGPQQGLGSRIASAAANTAYGRAWAYVLAAIITGLIFYLAIIALERLVTPRAAQVTTTA